MRSVNITMDLCSAAICLQLFVSLLLWKKRKNKLRNWFLAMCAVGFVMSLCDITNWAFEGLARPWYPAALWGGVLVYWICTSLMLLAFSGYLIEYISAKVKVHHGFWYAAAVLCVIHIVGIFMSVWTGAFFTITPENFYQRGKWFWLSQAIPFSIYFVDIIIFFFYRKGLNRKDFCILSSYIAIPLFAESVQMFNYGIAPLCMSVTLSLLIIYINIQSEQELRIAQQERELSEARADIMLSQIQPHFLYNSLTTIRQLCAVDPGLAQEVILDFTLYLRANMDSLKSKAPIPFEQELKHTEAYLALEQKRHMTRLRVVWDIGVKDFSIPPLTMQPIVENAVRYGALSRDEGGVVEVITEETKNAYVITIRDDGMGFAFQEHMDAGRSRIGIKNVRSRLTAMCRGTLDIYTTDGNGTTAVITIPKEDEPL